MSETTVRAAAERAAPAKHTTETSHDLPRIERWMKVMYSAFLPAIVALYVPDGVKPVLFTVTGLLFVAGLGLMLKSKRK